MDISVYIIIVTLLCESPLYTLMKNFELKC